MRALTPAWKWALGVFIVMRVALSGWAFIVATLVPVVVQNLDLFGAPVLAVFDVSSSARYAYSREVDGTVLTFRAGEPGTVVDIQTASVWNLREGRAVQGAYVGHVFSASAYSAEDIFPYRGVAPEAHPLLALWQRFDANYYVSIAARGYGATNGDTHFPPLYPVLIRAVALGGNLYATALILSNLALVIALVLFYQTTNQIFDDASAARATIYLVISPTAFFCFSAYSESLFLVAALLALRMIESRAWLWAGWWSFCAVLIRLQGIALMVPFVYAMWRERTRENLAARVSAIALPVVALAVYLGVRVAAGESAVLPTAEPNLAARLAPPWENYFYAIQTLATGKFHSVDVLNLGITTLCAFALAIGWPKLPRTYALYVAASLIVVTMRVVETQPLNSMMRYALTLFPIFMLMGDWGRRVWLQRAIVYSSFALALYLSAQFVLWGWVG